MDLSENLRENLQNLDNPRLELRYLISLEPNDIRMLDFEIVEEKARDWFFKGIRSFQKKEFEDAMELMENSISAIPNNPLAHWNIARLNYLNGDVKDSLKRFDKVFKSLSDKDLLREAKKEQDLVRRGVLEKEGLGPKA
jgi:tetratricopeptide (TPR) repeat protein